MKKFVLSIFFATTGIVTYAQVKNASQAVAALDQLMTRQFKAGEPGATVLIARKGQVIYKKAFGMANLDLQVPMHADDVFRIGSITKQFTAIAILLLMEQGKLSLQDEITRYLPDYPTQGAKITIENLLTHTSGIRDHASMPDTVQRSRMDFTPSQMINFFKDEPLRFAPGTRWEYSNSNYTLLGFIIEQVTGKPYGQYLQEQFFTPLGMTNSMYANDNQIVKNRVDGYIKTKKGYAHAPYISMTQPYAAGAILSTVADLFKWQQAVSTYQLVKKETLQKAWSRFQLHDGSATAYGYGWRMGYIQGSPSLWHGGLVSGFITMAMYLPLEDVFVTVLSNCENNSPVDLTAKLAALAIGKPYEHPPMVLDPGTLRHYPGVYENSAGQQRVVTVIGQQVFMQLNHAPKSLIDAYAKDQFYYEPDPLTTIEFGRNEKGEVARLTTKSRTAIDTWNKTNKPIPSENGISVDNQVLDSYVGEYEISPEFHFKITREKDRLWVEPTGQKKFEIFAETEAKFFLKINDAQLEFIKDSNGKVVKVVLFQGGRKTDARKID